MRVLYLTFDDLTVPFAWSVHVRSVVNALAARGHELRLVCPGGSAPGVNAPAVALPRGRWEHFIGSRASFVRAGRGFRPDVVYVRGIHGTTTPADAAEDLGVPLVVEVNGLLEAEVKSWWRRLRVRSVHRSTLRRAARVVAVSPLLAGALAERYGFPADRIDVVPNGVDPDLFRPGDRAAARARLELPADAPIAVCVASFRGHHGRGLLEEAARAAGVLLLLVGAEGNPEPGVRCAGRVPHDRVPDYLAAADLCLYALKAPDASFGFSPIKVFEYLAAGRPVVVASDLAEVRDLVTARGAGLATGLDAGAMAAAIRTLVGDPARREGMGAAGRAAVLAEFTWARTAERVEASLERARAILGKVQAPA